MPSAITPLIESPERMLLYPASTINTIKTSSRTSTLIPVDITTSDNPNLTPKTEVYLGMI